MPSALLFGSIGTLADTSELQRQAFNQAFAQHNLDWHWSREDYILLLEKSGGRQRIKDYAKEKGESVDAEAIHLAKSEIFQQLMRSSGLQLRAGVKSTIRSAKQAGLKVALVTTTSERNVETMLDALGSEISPNVFDLVVTKLNVSQPKPAKDAYTFAMQELDQTPDSCVAIEDNVEGVQAAKAADIVCIAFPGENTAHYAFDEADARTDTLAFEQISALFETA